MYLIDKVKEYLQVQLTLHKFSVCNLLFRNPQSMESDTLLMEEPSFIDLSGF